MIFLSLIDFLFDYISKKYRKWGETNLSGLYALGVISVLQTFNIITLWMLAIIFKIINPDSINQLYFYALFLIFMLINYLLVYRNKNQKILNNKFSQKIRLIALGYVIGSVICFLIPFVYHLYVLR